VDAKGPEQGIAQEAGGVAAGYPVQPRHREFVDLLPREDQGAEGDGDAVDAKDILGTAGALYPPLDVYRKLLIYGLWQHTANSLKQIGEIMKMDYAAVSAMVRIFKREMKTDKACLLLAERLAEEVMKRRIRKK
jgi:hypothetical protein